MIGFGIADSEIGVGDEVGVDVVFGGGARVASGVGVGTGRPEEHATAAKTKSAIADNNSFVLINFSSHPIRTTKGENQMVRVVD